MTQSSSVISICNRALLSVGARAQISSLTEGSTESNALAVLFQPTFEALARSANWNCLRQQVNLTLIAAAWGTPENPDGIPPLPPSPWLYQYELPSNSLEVRYLIPFFPNQPNGSPAPTTASIPAPTCLSRRDQIDFAVVYSTDAQNNPTQSILTNQTQAICVYTVNQSNPIIWDSLFEAAMVASLAAYLVPALSLNMPLMGAAIKVAESAIAQARVRDGDEGVTSQNRQADWMSARHSGTMWGYGSRDNLGFGYNSMCWPGEY